MASVSAGAGQAWEGGRQAAQALPGKRWLGCSKGKGDMEVAMWATGEPSAVRKW